MAAQLLARKITAACRPSGCADTGDSETGERRRLLAIAGMLHATLWSCVVVLALVVAALATRAPVASAVAGVFFTSAAISLTMCVMHGVASARRAQTAKEDACSTAAVPLRSWLVVLRPLSVLLWFVAGLVWLGCYVAERQSLGTEAAAADSASYGVISNLEAALLLVSLIPATSVALLFVLVRKSSDAYCAGLFRIAPCSAVAEPVLPMVEDRSSTPSKFRFKVTSSSTIVLPPATTPTAGNTAETPHLTTRRSRSTLRSSSSGSNSISWATAPSSRRNSSDTRPATAITVPPVPPIPAATKTDHIRGPAKAVTSYNHKAHLQARLSGRAPKKPNSSTSSPTKTSASSTRRSPRRSASHSSALSKTSSRASVVTRSSSARHPLSIVSTVEEEDEGDSGAPRLPPLPHLPELSGLGLRFTGLDEEREECRIRETAPLAPLAPLHSNAVELPAPAMTVADDKGRKDSMEPMRWHHGRVEDVPAPLTVRKARVVSAAKVRELKERRDDVTLGMMLVSSRPRDKGVWRLSRVEEFGT